MNAKLNSNDFLHDVECEIRRGRSLKKEVEPDPEQDAERDAEKFAKSLREKLVKVNAILN